MLRKISAYAPFSVFDFTNECWVLLLYLGFREGLDEIAKAVRLGVRNKHANLRFSKFHTSGAPTHETHFIYWFGNHSRSTGSHDLQVLQLFILKVTRS